MATLLWSGNFPGGHQWERRNHLCVQSSLLQRNYPAQTPTSLGAWLPWPSPRSTCCKASQFAAHFVLDIKVEWVWVLENNVHWQIHEFQRKTNGHRKRNSILFTLLVGLRSNSVSLVSILTCLVQFFLRKFPPRLRFANTYTLGYGCLLSINPLHIHIHQAFSFVSFATVLMQHKEKKIIKEKFISYITLLWDTGF